MKWLKFYFRCFVIACISFKQNSWNGNYFSKLGGGVSVFTGMNQPYEWNEKYARHLLSRLCILQAITGRTNKFDSALPVIFNYLCVTQSIQGLLYTQFVSSNLVYVWFITCAVMPGGITSNRRKSEPFLLASESEQFWPHSVIWAGKTLMANKNRCWFCPICAWCLLLTQTNHPNGPRPKH